ncbi:NYN domain-containing protein [Alteraurantiacibacter buctensis]|uniref:NYN domain-containing protein n=1 Tax=Alteraurantiacibacter buctensis TaxID=1503981 RepID=A0A844YYA1_9SPHN|nr:NYN domain-containing protein [Alteraurantiacibacter buctensis]MXO71761.1 NYN domain-containing protein [Alteraurantiacibacter buctensis]
MFLARYAILLDGGFVTKKLQQKLKQPATADDIVALCGEISAHAELRHYELLRTYFYDAPPSLESLNQPVSGERYNLAVTERAKHAQSLYDQLELKPGFALRMGETRLTPQQWKLKPRSVQQIKAEPRPLVDDDFLLDINQKGVDIRIGLDMARLALRDMVRAVVVVTGDSDFVPAFKFVRREGVKVMLCTLGHASARRELKAHADFVLS